MIYNSNGEIKKKLPLKKPHGMNYTILRIQRYMEKVIVYIDGFNLYFGMKEKGWRRYYWLNVHLLAKNLLKPHQVLVKTKYFTNRISSTPDDPGKSKRQGTYIEALNMETITLLSFFS